MIHILPNPHRVNLILFAPTETTAPLPRTDPRALHILRVLRRIIGDTFDCGLVNGPRGKGTVVALDAQTLTLAFAWDALPPPPPAPITLVLGLPRPQTARDILRDATSLGVAELHFVTTEKGDPNYARSTLWSSDEWQRHLVIGAEQAFDTRLPLVTHGRPLADVVAGRNAAATSGASPAKTDSPANRLVLDNYESPAALSACNLLGSASVALAFGPERGWSAAERDLFRSHSFTFAHLGTRVLRTETAVIAAVALIRAKLGLL